MAQKEDQPYFRPSDPTPQRNIFREMSARNSHNTSNFQWGRMAMVAVPAVTLLLGTYHIADRLIGRQDRIDHAPPMAVSNFIFALTNRANSGFSFGGNKSNVPTLVKITGWAEFEKSQTVCITNGTSAKYFVERSYRFSADLPQAPVEAEALSTNFNLNTSNSKWETQPVKSTNLDNSSINLSRTNLPKLEAPAFQLSFITREAVRDYAEPFPPLLQEQTHPIEVELTVPTRPGRQDLPGTNSYRLRPLEVRVIR